MSPGPRRATPADRPSVSRTLARAFADDPIKLFLTGGDVLAEHKVMKFFDVFQRVQMRHGHVYTTHDGAAAAIWAPPGEWKVPLRSIVRHTPTLVNLYGARFIPNLGVLNLLEREHPTEPHYYLEFVGTDPEHQGKGLASSLIRPMVERADVEAVGMYLECSKESNVPFYARFGFEVRKEIQHRRGGPTQWLMWRDPQLG